jgi:hypothetical protein
MTSTQLCSFMIRQLEHRYRVVERCLGHGLSDELLWKRLGDRPPIGWHAAHLASAVASTAEAVALGESAIEVAANVQAAARRRDPAARRNAISYTPVELGTLTREWNRLSSIHLTALKSLTDGELEKPPLTRVREAFQSTLTSRMVFLEGHLFHVSYHLGAMGLLRAEWRLAP